MTGLELLIAKVPQALTDLQRERGQEPVLAFLSFGILEGQSTHLS